MNSMLLSVVVAGTGALIYAERKGARVFPNLRIRGDFKRESKWFAQYGQGACTVAVALLIWCMDDRTVRFGVGNWCPVVGAVFWSALTAYVIKRLLGRVRPGFEGAGHFLGLKPGHENARESFPSSHTACAVAMTVVLAQLYPDAAFLVWSLAILCALLRYVMEAHWPSDILGGFALGYMMGWASLKVAGVW